jgi:HPt (histidine-containing phosphotransfer) domain-containing protein
VATPPAGIDPQVNGSSSLGSRPADGERADLGQALEQLSGDHELLQDLVRAFIEQWPIWRQQLSDALNEGDRDALRRLGHAIKGALGHFGLPGAVDLALQLEHLADNVDPREPCQTLVGAVDAVLPELSDFVGLEPGLPR